MKLKTSIDTGNDENNQLDLVFKFCGSGCNYTQFGIYLAKEISLEKILIPFKLKSQKFFQPIEDSFKRCLKCFILRAPYVEIIRFQKSKFDSFDLRLIELIDEKNFNSGFGKIQNFFRPINVRKTRYYFSFVKEMNYENF